jgi:hypothetical protein
MSKKRTTGSADAVECPGCSATLDLSGLSTSIRGFGLKCSACESVLVTVGGMIAGIEDKPIQSVSLEVMDAAANFDSDLPVAPASPVVFSQYWRLGRPWLNRLVTDVRYAIIHCRFAMTLARLFPSNVA